jgi:hypothetical protein
LFVTQWAEEIRAEMAISQHYHFTEPAAPPPMDGKTLKTSTMQEGRGERRLTRVMRSISKSRFTYT